ncbi:hypothetical protein N8650_02015 [Akkermansiaceae bacterium]|nr:hypothetical protein [Akkermansiaceae bacterium]MDA7656892.1 hypothetical protein [bacterium]MDA7500314.1 hypothetical protein [Akkermansiaceae bacterium]MDA7608673.1 hypothetical protein [Akkermansiaceae bacterium]MDA7615723.1 hypothetical protein [Akkermansiaceae bacterium]
MRRLITFFFAASLRVFSGEPSEVALEFLRGFDGDLSEAEISSSLAISPFCGPKKKDRIVEFWEARGSWKQNGNYSFRPLREKMDDNLSAVLIGATSPNGPDVTMVISLGVVRREGKWKVAPVEGSFENTGLGFEVDLKSRVRDLENWMALERTSEMTSLLRSEMGKFRKKMEGAVLPEVLAGNDAKQAMQEFLNAAEAGKTDSMIVWQGFLERESLPERDWEMHLKATRKGMVNQDKQRVWRLLSSQKVMKVITSNGTNDIKVHAEEGVKKEAEFLVGFLSSFEIEGDRLSPVRFRLNKTNQGWRVSLPAFFAYADQESRAFRTAKNDESDWKDREVVKKMFQVFEEQNQVVRAKSPDALLKAIIGDLETQDLDSFLQRHYREEKKAVKEGEKPADGGGNLLVQPAIIGRRGNPFDDRRSGRYIESVKWWGSSLKSRDPFSAKIVKLYRREKITLGILSFSGSGENWKPKYQQVWMRQDASGWMILPGKVNPMVGTYLEGSEEDLRALSEQFVKDEVKLEEKFFTDVLKIVGRENPEGKAASEPQAKALVKEWRRIAREEDMMAFLSVSAVRKLPAKPTSLLRDLGFVRKGAASAMSPDQIIGSKAVGRFRGVSMMIDHAGGVDRACPLVLVVPTKIGHCVLVDVELPLETNKGIRLLNDERLESLAKEVSKEDLAAIEELREWHQKVSRPVWGKWKSEQADKE